MREIRIVITDTSVSFPDGQELGRVGEHNATQLLIELPAEMVEGIDYHIIKFNLLGGAITSDIITEDDSKQIYISDGIIYCTLWQQLTASRGLSFTVEAYAVVDDEPVLIAKSPLVKGLRFEQSVDAGAEADEQGYSIAVHVANLDKRLEGKVDKVTDKGLSTNDYTDEDKANNHTHANKALLDAYNGNSGGGMVVDTLPQNATNGDIAYLKASYDEFTPIPSSEFLNEGGYFHIDFADGWDTAELLPTQFNALEIPSSTSAQLLQLQLVDAETAYNSLGADTVVIVVVKLVNEESVVYIYPISDVPALEWDSRKWYETTFDFTAFTEVEKPDISIPYPYFLENLDMPIVDTDELDKVFAFSRVKKHLSGLYRYQDGWVRIFSDSVTDIDLLTQRVNDNNRDRLFLSSNATYNLNTTNSQVNIYVIMPENVNDEIDNSILLKFYCDVDKNLIFDENVNIAEIDTTAGYHELIMTYNKAEGKWWVRQTAEEWL